MAFSPLYLNQLNNTFHSVSYLSYIDELSVPTQDCTTSLQNFLLDCNLLALQLKGSGEDDQAQRAFVTAFMPRAYYNLSCPIIVPELVNLRCEGMLARQQQGFPVNPNYTGDTTSKALGNAYQPTLIIPARAHCEQVDIICNPNGDSYQGAGMVVGKNWTAGSITIGNGGAGYVPGDVITLAQPSKSPYIATTVTVNTVNGSGAILTGTILEPGGYALPPVLQQIQWTSANGFSVFDSSGNFLTTGGTGSGATIGVTFQPDWSTGVTTYNYGRGGFITDTQLGKIRIAHVGITNDSTYGNMNAFSLYGLNADIDTIEVQGGFNGFNFHYAADIRANALNCVGSTNPAIFYSCSSITCPQVVFDTPHGNLQIDNSNGVQLKGRMFNRNLNNYPGAPGATPPSILIGANSTSSSQSNTGIILDLELYLAGAGNSTPANAGNVAVQLSNISASRIDLNIDNCIGSYGGPPPVITSFANFGSNVGNDLDLRGAINSAGSSYPTLNLFSGTYPGCGARIWDASVGGYCGPYGIYEIYGSGSPSNGTGGTGAGKAAPGSVYTNISNGAKYYNSNTLASPTWTAL